MNSLVATIRQKTRHAVSLLTAKEEGLSHGQRRYHRIGRGVATSILQKGSGFLLTFLTVPLTIHYLGSELYGLWITLTSLITWLGFSDIGMGNSLVLALSQADGRDDKVAAKKAVSAAFFAFCIVSLVLLTAFFLIAPHISWDKLLKIHSEATGKLVFPSLVAFFVPFALWIPLSIGGRVLMGYQEYSLGNLTIVTSNILTIAVIVCAAVFKAPLPILIWGYAGVGTVVGLIYTIWVCGWHKPWLRPSIHFLKSDQMLWMLKKGVWYFLTAVSVVVSMQTDTVIISHYLGLKAVTPYNVTWRLFSYALMITGMFAMMTPSYGEASARGDREWLRKTFKRHFYFSVIVAGTLCLFFFSTGAFLIRHWAGAVAVPSRALLGWMAAWDFMLGILYPITFLLNGTGNPKPIAIFGGIGAVINLFLAIFWVQKYGVAGVAAASAVSLAVFNFPPLAYMARKLVTPNRKIMNLR